MTESTLPSVQSIQELLASCEESNSSIESAFVDHVNALCELTEPLVKIHNALCSNFVAIETMIDCDLSACRRDIALQLLKKFGSHVVGKQNLSSLIADLSAQLSPDTDVQQVVNDEVWQRHGDLI